MTIDKGEINGEYLALYMNSIIGKALVEREVGGSVIMHWKPDQVNKLPIPIIPNEEQETIASFVQQSHCERRNFQQLLEKAKHLVEEIIEKT